MSALVQKWRLFTTIEQPDIGVRSTKVRTGLSRLSLAVRWRVLPASVHTLALQLAICAGESAGGNEKAAPKDGLVNATGATSPRPRFYACGPTESSGFMG